MRIIVIPYHDSRKWKYEGERTRDAHLTREITRLKQVKELQVVNRPRSFIEKLITLQKDNRSNYETIDHDYNHYFHELLFNKRKWVYRAYSNIRLDKRIKKNVYDACICFNPYAIKMYTKINAKVKVFDFYDNFLRIPLHKQNYKLLEELYQISFSVSDAVVVVSEANRTRAKNFISENKIHIINNGINFDHIRSAKKSKLFKNDDYQKTIGCAAKVTHLIDFKLYEYLIKNNPDYQFIHIGQLLQEELIKPLLDYPNFKFLGDIHYEEYPKYLQSFDICIVPYCQEDSHGGDSIKIGEYIVSGNPVISTPGNGADKYANYIHITNNKKEFSKLLRELNISEKEPDSYLTSMSWQNKAKEYLQIIKNSL